MEQEIESDMTTEEAAARIIWRESDDESGFAAVKDMVRTLRDLPFRGATTRHYADRYAGAQQFFTQFLYEHVVDGFGLKDDTMHNAWNLHRALMKLAKEERDK